MFGSSNFMLFNPEARIINPVKARKASRMIQTFPLKSDFINSLCYFTKNPFWGSPPVVGFSKSPVWYTASQKSGKEAHAHF
jgi:hypothetical protein